MKDKVAAMKARKIQEEMIKAEEKEEVAGSDDEVYEVDSDHDELTSNLIDIGSDESLSDMDD